MTSTLFLIYNSFLGNSQLGKPIRLMIIVVVVIIMVVMFVIIMIVVFIPVVFVVMGLRLADITG
jgi:hypothetical protein